MIKDEATVGQDPQEQKDFSLWGSKVSSVGGFRRESSLSVKKTDKTQHLNVEFLLLIRRIS